MDIYVDQNVLGHVAAGRYALPTGRGIRWIYSDEHFTEIARGGKEDLLDVLRAIHACRIRIIGDARKRITDLIEIDDYVDPEEPFRQFLAWKRSQPIDQATFFPVVAAMFGAKNASELASYAERLATQIQACLRDSPTLDSAFGGHLAAVALRTGRETARVLADVQPLESRRKGLNLHKGRASQLSNSDNPIEALWLHANRHHPASITCDQFVGFDPLYPIPGYGKIWPQFLRIAACYALLNSIGFHPDKGLARTERVGAYISDGNHVAYAAWCDRLMSADSRLCVKAHAIYRYRRIKTEVLDLSGLLEDCDAP